MRATLRVALFCSPLRRYCAAESRRPLMANATPSNEPSSAGAGGVNDDGGPDFSLSAASSMERLFQDFRVQLEESGNIRERIRGVATEMEAALRVMHAKVLMKAKAQTDVLRDLYGRLAGILRECPGQYYRYHGDWRSETQNAVSLLSFVHWLESASLLTHVEAESKLGLDSSEFGMDTEDYLIGLCFMSNELPRYVVNRVTAGDYDCPRKVLNFLTELHSAFRMLNLRNDFLRKKFDGMKYDLRRVEEVYYDVKIRGLAPVGCIQDQGS